MPAKGVVFIAVPTYRGVMCPPFANSLKLLFEKLEGSGYTAVLGTTQGLFIPMARAELVRKAILSKADKVLFLDDDVSFDPRDAIRLLDINEEIVAGIYPMKCDPIRWPVVIYTNDNGTPVVDERGFIVAKRVPMGFTAIKIDAILRMQIHYRDRWFTHDHVEDGHVTCYDLFPSGVYNNKWFTEDFAFCMLWEQMGGKLFVMPDVTLNHHGIDGRVWSGNYHEMLRACPQP
jgi:hypothetical protein